jgi:hypothetical protein
MLAVLHSHSGEIAKQNFHFDLFVVLGHQAISCK